MVQDCLTAAHLLAADGVSVEVIDLRTISPLDRETVLDSLAKTNRMVIAHEAVRDFGFRAELAAMAVDEGLWHLDAPVTRVAPPPRQSRAPRRWNGCGFPRSTPSPRPCVGSQRTDRFSGRHQRPVSSRPGSMTR